MSSLPGRYPAAPQSVSGVVPAAGKKTMAERLWGIDFGALLPWVFDGVEVTCEPLEHVAPFIARLFPETFNQGGQWLHEPMTEAKRRFGEEMDVFVFRDGGAVVGVLIGHPSDWSTYYWRTAAFLPEYRGKHLLTRTVERVFTLLREAGVRRTEFDTSPGNDVMVRHFTAQGFVITATLSSERWGQMLRFTKFLDEDAERVFRAQFLDVPKTIKRERSPS